MKTKIVYVLASSPSDYFYEQCLISAKSAKEYNHSARIILICDNRTKETLCGIRSEIGTLFSEIITVKFDDSVSNLERSRRMKVNLRSYVQGDFLYIDCDTLVVQDLSDIDKCEYSLAAVLDGHCGLKSHVMRSFFYKQNLAFNPQIVNEEYYFSGGVIFSKDDAISHTFYKRWANNYERACSLGINIDEPALCLANQEMEHVIAELDGVWNCQVRFGALYLSSAKILHFCSKKNMPISRLSSRDYLYNVKQAGLNTPSLEAYITNWRKAIIYPIVISTDVDAIYNTLPDYEQKRRIQYNKLVQNQIYIPKNKGLMQWLRSLRNYSLGIINPKLLSEILYKEKFGRAIDEDPTESLNKKIYRLAFFGNPRQWSSLADKLAVREYVISKGYKSILPRLYGHWRDSSKINSVVLPNKFVLKCNHDNGSVIIIEDKFSIDWNYIISYYKKRLNGTFGISSAEPHYRHIIPSVLAEEKLENDKSFSNGLVSYKFFAFSGDTRYCQVVYDTAEHKYQRSLIYDVNGWIKCANFITKNQGDINIPRPSTLDKMIEVVKTLSSEFPFVRIDLYEVNNKVYFSEMTFMPAAGRITNFSQEFLEILGKNVLI